MSRAANDNETPRQLWLNRLYQFLFFQELERQGRTLKTGATAEEYMDVFLVVEADMERRMSKIWRDNERAS